MFTKKIITHLNFNMSWIFHKLFYKHSIITKARLGFFSAKSESLPETQRLLKYVCLLVRAQQLKGRGLKYACLLKICRR